MASLHVRNVSDDLVVKLKERAVRNGRSAEAEHREILKEILASDDKKSWEELASLSRKMTQGRIKTPSELMLREDRDR